MATLQEESRVCWSTLAWILEVPRGSTTIALLVFCIFIIRYYLTFDWVKEVVTIKQAQPLSKFDKWWFSKLMCIEGNFV